MNSWLIAKSRLSSGFCNATPSRRGHQHFQFLTTLSGLLSSSLGSGYVINDCGPYETANFRFAFRNVSAVRALMTIFAPSRINMVARIRPIPPLAAQTMAFLPVSRRPILLFLKLVPFNKLKHFSAVATGYDKRNDNFRASVQSASIRIGLHHNESAT